MRCRVLLAVCALALAGSQAHAQALPGRGPGFRPGFQFVSTSAVYDADFGAATYTGGPPSIARGSTGYAADSGGTYSVFAADALRRTNAGLTAEPADTNAIRNNAMQGAAAGSPGTLPTNWYSGQPAGLTRSVVGTGTESGIDYIDIRFSGTATAAGTIVVGFESGAAVPAASGQTWSGSFFNRLAAGSFTGLTNPVIALIENDSSGNFVSGASYSQAVPTGAALGKQRAVASRAFSGGATVANAQLSYNITVANGAAVDITLRIGWPHLSQSTRALSPIRTTSGAVTRQADTVTLPVAGIGRVVVTYDDGSSQAFTGISPATPWVVPVASLARSVIRRLTGFAS